MLETKNVFLDTSAIIEHNFDYSSPSFRRLEELAAAGDARLLTTTITVSEVEANIRERVQGAKTAFERLREKHPILKNLPNFEFDPAKAEAILIGQFHEYLTRTKTEVLRPPASSIDDVFEKYFGLEPPFSEKKKEEFPDAFAISTLESWCSEHGEKLYVVGTDPDLSAACAASQHLLSLSRPSEFIDMVLRQDAQMRLVEDSTGEKTDAIVQAIADEFSRLGFYLDDEDGDVNEVEVENVEIQELSLLEARGTAAKFDVTVTIKFAAEVSYDDMDSAIWDSEDKVSIPLHTIKTTLEREEEFNVTMDVRLSDEGHFQEVQQIKFASSDVAITVRDDDPYR